MVKAWLHSLGLEQYFDQFLAAGMTDLAQCSRLSPQSLGSMHINLPGHKKRLFREGERAWLHQYLDCLQTPFSLKIRWGLINPSNASYNRSMNEKGLGRNDSRSRLVPILLVPIFRFMLPPHKNSYREKQTASSQVNIQWAKLNPFCSNLETLFLLRLFA